MEEKQRTLENQSDDEVENEESQEFRKEVNLCISVQFLVRFALDCNIIYS